MRRCDDCKRNLYCDSIWKTSGDRVTSCVCWTPIRTRSDTIRSLTDKQLAEWLVVLSIQQIKRLGVRVPTDDKEIKEAIDWWLEWLKEEVPDADINQDR